MRGIALDMQIECDCGNLLEVKHPDPNASVKTLKEYLFICAVCETRFFLHIQQSKKAACQTIPDSV